MRTLPLPAFKVEQVIDRCIADAASHNLRDKLLLAKEAIMDRETALETCAETHEWWHYLHSTMVGTLSNAEMKSLYTDEMSEEGGSAFRFYSRIKNSAPHNKCPLCSVGVVSSVDHYLPKSRYSDLTVTPSNLIPACNDCNKFKHIRFPRSFSQQFVHPYYDDFTNARWVRARVDDVGQPLVSYYVDSDGAYSADEQERLISHFRYLRLERLFGSNAAEQLTTERENLIRASEAGGSEGVISYLSEQI